MKKKLLFLLTLSTIILCGCGDCKKDEQPKVERVILLIGDGMGVAHVTDLIMNSPQGSVNMERAHAVGLVKTNSANNRVTDSAAAGTALATGYKTDNSKLGVDSTLKPLKNLTEICHDHGIPTGLVATVSITHATPAAFYAHTSYRGNMEIIAKQLIHSNVDVFMGGGRKFFEQREDGLNLSDSLRKKGFCIAYDMADVQNLTHGKVGVMLTEDHMPYISQGRGNFLPEATEKTLEILSNNNDRFFAMIEGSQIDYAAHYNIIEDVRLETEDFDKAVGKAFDYCDVNPGTLVIVLADHETGGLTIVPDIDNFEEADSGVSYKFSTGGHSASMIALYAYGSGAKEFSRVLDNTEIAPLITKLMGINQ